jgi:hypothetical protein
MLLVSYDYLFPFIILAWLAERCGVFPPHEQLFNHTKLLVAVMNGPALGIGAGTSSRLPSLSNRLICRVYFLILGSTYHV